MHTPQTPPFAPGWWAVRAQPPIQICRAVADQVSAGWRLVHSSDWMEAGLHHAPGEHARWPEATAFSKP
eukprot:739675-Pelagomonas_calceolata.AAC.2